jgi:DUF4097 and DUF4098 domain-containing protein YvlB
MNKYLLLSCLVVFTLMVCTDTTAQECEFDRLVEQSLDVSGSDSLAIAAAAGDLSIKGVSASDEVTIRGKICVSEEEWLEEVSINTGAGTQAEINVVLPDVSSGWSFWGNKYAYMDLELEVPSNLTLQLRDSSGDIRIANIHAISIRDSSGDIEIDHASGPVEIEDSSGDIEVRELQGDFTVVSDSSGDIRGNDIEGTARVVADSSGDIRFTAVGKDVIVERDSSGDIFAENVGGDFSVLKDSSGDIRTIEVGGEVVIPEHKK